jgi:hypothetical protein
MFAILPFHLHHLNSQHQHLIIIVQHHRRHHHHHPSPSSAIIVIIIHHHHRPSSSSSISKLLGYKWVVLQQFALTESGSALHSEACHAAGASDAVARSIIYHEALRSRAIAIIIIIISSIIDLNLVRA